MPNIQDRFHPRSGGGVGFQSFDDPVVAPPFASFRDIGLQQDPRLQYPARRALSFPNQRFKPFAFLADIRGWINYYSHFYKSALYSTLRLIDDHLTRWAQRKFKHLRQRPKRARTWLAGMVRRTPGLFPHWRLLYANGRMLGAV